jgi:hypothetical protein
MPYGDAAVGCTTIGRVATQQETVLPLRQHCLRFTFDLRPHGMRFPHLYDELHH